MQELTVRREEILPGDHVIGIFNTKDEFCLLEGSNSYTVLGIHQNYLKNEIHIMCLNDSRIYNKWQFFYHKYKVLRNQQ